MQDDNNLQPFCGSAQTRQAQASQHDQEHEGLPNGADSGSVQLKNRLQKRDYKGNVARTRGSWSY